MGRNKKKFMDRPKNGGPELRNHPEIRPFRNLMGKACAELAGILRTQEPTEARKKQLFYLQHEGRLCVGVRLLKFNEEDDVTYKLDAPTVCSELLLKIDYVAKYIREFREKIRLGETEIDWELALSTTNSRIIIQKKRLDETNQTNAISEVSNTDNRHETKALDEACSEVAQLANRSVPIVANPTSNLSVPNDADSSGVKRGADELISQSNAKQIKLSSGKDDFGAECLSVSIDGNDGNHEKLNSKMETESHDALITIELD